MLKVLGIGNILRGDDGIGPKIISELSKKSVSLEVEFIDAGSDSFKVLDYLTGNDPVILIDCARMGRSAGEVVRFKLNKANILVIDKAISLHGFGFGEVFKMAEKLGKVADCTVIGIEPKSIEFNTGLSNEVKNSIPYILDMVVEEINYYGKKNINY